MQAKTEYHLVAKWYTADQDRELWKRLIAVTPRGRNHTNYPHFRSLGKYYCHAHVLYGCSYL